jgi:uncharacterized protein (DUF1499 family)
MLSKRQSVFLVMVLLSGLAATGEDFPMKHPKIDLAPCPDTPNCVSSLSVDLGHKVEPLSFQFSQSQAFQHLVAIISSMPRTKLVRSGPNYLHFEFRSALFKFVDDVEFTAGNASGIIHVRSASRTGYWDLGVNRKRVERIREAFSERSVRDRSDPK